MNILSANFHQFSVATQAKRLFHVSLQTDNDLATFPLPMLLPEAHASRNKL